MSQAFHVPDMPEWSRNNISDLLRAMSMKVSVKDGTISK